MLRRIEPYSVALKKFARIDPDIDLDAIPGDAIPDAQEKMHPSKMDSSSDRSKESTKRG